MAGGTGSRLFPNTVGINKHLIPIFDKPMIYYSLSTFMLAGIREILIICNEEDRISYKKIFGSGDKLGLKISYKTQDNPRGIADAFLLAEDFINGDSVCLTLGDNIFHSNQLKKVLQGCVSLQKGAYVFAYPVADPSRYGVIEFNTNHEVTNIVEKPKHPKTNFAVPGIYFYDNRVVELAKTIKPSPRGELEITAINNIYLKEGTLRVKEFGRGSVWFDTGTTQSLYDATEYIETVEKRQGLKISCIEEIAVHMGYITTNSMLETISDYPDSEYKNYLRQALAK